MRKEIDPARLEALAASGKKTPEIYQALGISDVTFYTRVNADPALKAAFARGKATAKDNGAGKPMKLDPNDEAVLDAVEAFRTNGANWERIKGVALTARMSDAEIRGSLQRLLASGAIHRAGDSYFPGQPSPGNASTDEREKAEVTNEMKPRTKRAATATKPKRTYVRKAKSSDEKELAASGNGFQIEPETKPVNSQHNRALAVAFTELSYFKTWGEASPRFNEVLEIVSDAVATTPGT